MAFSLAQKRSDLTPSSTVELTSARRLVAVFSNSRTLELSNMAPHERVRPSGVRTLERNEAQGTAAPSDEPASSSPSLVDSSAGTRAGPVVEVSGSGSGTLSVPPSTSPSSVAPGSLLVEARLLASTQIPERHERPESQPPPIVHWQLSAPVYSGLQGSSLTQRPSLQVLPVSHVPPSVHSHPRRPTAQSPFTTQVLSIDSQRRPSSQLPPSVQLHPTSPSWQSEPGTE